MATINTNHAKARVIANMLLECGVPFAYRLDVENPSSQHREVIEVADSRRELLRECLHLATERFEREAATAAKMGLR